MTNEQRKKIQKKRPIERPLNIIETKYGEWHLVEILSKCSWVGIRRGFYHWLNRSECGSVPWSRGSPSRELSGFSRLLPRSPHCSADRRSLLSPSTSASCRHAWSVCWRRETPSPIPRFLTLSHPQR